MSEGYKYEIGTRVKNKADLSVECKNIETGEEYEVIIPAGAEGEIESLGRDSRYYMADMYYVTFKFNDTEEEVIFFLADLEDNLEMTGVNSGE